MAMLSLALAVLGALIDTTKATLRKKVIIGVLIVSDHDDLCYITLVSTLEVTMGEVF